MSEEKKTEDLWASIASGCQNSIAETEPPKFAGLSQVPTLRDRLTQRLLNGTVPLFLVSVLVMSLLGFAGHTSSLVAGPLLSLLFCWLLAPFLSAGGHFSFLRVLFFSPIITGFTVLALLLPLQFDRSFLNRENKLHFLFAHDLQASMERFLTLKTMAILTFTCLLISLTIRWILSQSPWLESPRIPNSRFIAGGLLLAAVLVIPGFVILTNPYNQKIEHWKERIEQELQTKPSWRLPKTGKDELWDPLMTERSLAFQSGTEKTNPQRRALEINILKACRLRRPNNTKTLQSVARALKWSLFLEESSSDLSADEKTEMAGYLVDYNLILRACYQIIDSERAFKKHLLPVLLRPKLSEQELEMWKKKIETMAEHIVEDRFQELDFNAFDYLVKNDRTDIIVALKDDTLHKAAGKASPLKAFGLEFSPSPTELVSRYEDKAIFEDWFELYRELQSLSPPQCSERL